MPLIAPLVLASTSTYRQELLSRLQLPFSVAAPNADEFRLKNEAPIAMARRLAEAKARSIAPSFPGALIIGSDQVAYHDDEIFGKPGNRDAAIKQLSRLSGKSVDFVTGLCLLNDSTGACHVREVTTRVSFRTLSAATIEAYVTREPAFNCAGSAKSEGLGIALMSQMHGDDPTALIGLPLIALCDLLALEGVAVPA